MKKKGKKRSKEKKNKQKKGRISRVLLFIKKILLKKYILYPLLFVVFTWLLLLPSNIQTQLNDDSHSLWNVKNVTGLYSILVNKVITPRSVGEIQEAVKGHNGKISIGGGRYSMGGQTAGEGTMQIDTRQFDKVVDFNKDKKEIVVQSGITWRKLQEYIDPYDLSVKIMQSYANFTVGGSMSVNVHGRYIGHGPIISSVKSFRIVLADGSLIQASPEENSEIFYSAIGGYGAIGIITDATLQLEDNTKVERSTEKISIQEYLDYFNKNIKNNPEVVFHNADIYAGKKASVNSITYKTTTKDLTIDDRLSVSKESYKLEQFFYWVVSEWPFGKKFREHVLDPYFNSQERIVWRNYEASYDVIELEPKSREDSTYVLQEYFVPVDDVMTFYTEMAHIFDENSVNIMNISIRHAEPDEGSYLSWAREEVFAFVVYYKQGTDYNSKEHVKKWTRELIDVVTKYKGSYYLPYQQHATQEQFYASYPRAKEFFEVKKKYDPDYKFKNSLWENYYNPYLGITDIVAQDIRAYTNTIENYSREESQSFLTFPEWYIVYTFDDLGKFLKTNSSYNFHYFSSIWQYWKSYGTINKHIYKNYEENPQYQTMLRVIGWSHSFEMFFKGIYENTIGRITSIPCSSCTPEEDYYQTTMEDYGQFMHLTPWYEYPFFSKIPIVWTQMNTLSESSNYIKSFERKIFMTIDFAFKGVYAKLIAMGVEGSYEPQETSISGIIQGDITAIKSTPIRLLKSFDDIHVVEFPRYEDFTTSIMSLIQSEKDITILEVAGNEKVLISGIKTRSYKADYLISDFSHSFDSLTSKSHERFFTKVALNNIINIIKDSQNDESLEINHIYDY